MSSNKKSDYENKYFVSDLYSGWVKYRDAVWMAERDYCTTVLATHNDVTRNQVKREFWQRIAEFYGFEIKFKNEQPSANDLA